MKALDGTVRVSHPSQFGFAKGGIHKNRGIGKANLTTDKRGSSGSTLIRRHQSALLANVNHRLVVLSAFSIFVVFLNGDRLIVFCERDGPGARRSVTAAALGSELMR